jgi:hypothetical protein
MASYILNVSTGGRSCLFSRVALLSMAILWYTFSRRLGGPQSQFGMFTEDTNPLILPEIEPHCSRCLALSPASVSDTVSKLAWNL